MGILEELIPWRRQKAVWAGAAEVVERKMPNQKDNKLKRKHQEIFIYFAIEKLRKNLSQH